MSPRVRVTTHTYTRLDALKMHAARFLELAGVDASLANKLADAIEHRELDAVGVMGTDTSNRLVVEQEFEIDWGEHDRIMGTAPVVDASQPGWESHLAAEVRLACERFRKVVERLDLRVRTWVRFAKRITSNPAEYERKLSQLGYGGKKPQWKGAYNEFRMEVTGLGEATIVMRVYEG